MGPKLARVVVTFLVLLSVTVLPLDAQVVRGTVVAPDSAPVAGVIVMAADRRGDTMGRALTNDLGHFTLRLPAAGAYVLTMLRIGYRPTPGPTIDVGASVVPIRLVFTADPVVLSLVSVNAVETCQVSADTGLMVARVWEEARKAMLSTQLSAADAPLFAEWIEYDRMLDSASRIVRDQRVRTTRTPTTHAFRSEPAHVLAAKGYVVAERGVTTFHAPDAEVLLSDEFAAGHCFHVEASPPTEAHLIGIGFAPTRDRRHMRDIEGTLWLDRASAELRRLEFRYTSLPAAARAAGAGGRVEFIRLDDGNWLVSRWNLTMPQLTAEVPMFSGLRRIVVSGTRVALRGVKVTGGELTAISRRDTLLYQLLGSELVVNVGGGDDLVRPGHAILELEGTDYVKAADATGRIELAPVLPGRYRARVRTPLMDSLGMSPVVRDIEPTVEGRVETVVLPTARALLRVEVTDIDGNPLSQVTVEARPARGPARTGETGANGTVVLRDLAPGTLSVGARRLGFRAGNVEVSVTGGRTVLPLVMSKVAAPTLDTVRVADRAQPAPRLRDFESRRLNHQATASITREDILKRNPTDAWQMLTNVPSVRIVDIDTMVVARSARTTIANYENDYCYMLVLVDGVLMNRDGAHKAVDLRFLPRPEEIHGIEVFAGAASIPVQYGGSGDGKWCGMIAIWTR